MTESAAVPFVCHLDFVRRSSISARRRTVLLAKHLAGHPSLSLAEPLLADMTDGRSLARHLPPLKNQRYAYKRAHRKGTWRDTSGQRFEPGKRPEAWLDSPHCLVLGLDPDDPRTTWELAAAQAGMLMAGRRTA